MGLGRRKLTPIEGPSGTSADPTGSSELGWPFRGSQSEARRPGLFLPTSVGYRLPSEAGPHLGGRQQLVAEDSCQRGREL